MSGQPTIAIVGATGAVGAELLGCMERRNFPVGELRLLASARSAGKELGFRGRAIAVQELKEDRFDGVDIALFSAGGKISRQFCPKAAQRAAVVVDNSSAFRMDPTAPLATPPLHPQPLLPPTPIIPP